MCVRFYASSSLAFPRFLFQVQCHHRRHNGDGSAERELSLAAEEETFLRRGKIHRKEEEEENNNNNSALACGFVLRAAFLFLLGGVRPSSKGINAAEISHPIHW